MLLEMTIRWVENEFGSPASHPHQGQVIFRRDKDGKFNPNIILVGDSENLRQRTHFTFYFFYK